MAYYNIGRRIYENYGRKVFQYLERKVAKVMEKIYYFSFNVSRINFDDNKPTQLLIKERQGDAWKWGGFYLDQLGRVGGGQRLRQIVAHRVLKSESAHNVGCK